MRVTVTPRWNNALIYQAPDTGQRKTSLLSWCHSKSPAPSWEQKPVSVRNMARFPSHVKRSATGVSKRLFIHFSEFTRAGRKKTKNTVMKKISSHFKWALCYGWNPTFAKFTQSFVTEFLLTWKQDSGKTWLMQQTFSQRRRFLYSILLTAKICFLSIIQEKKIQPWQSKNFFTLKILQKMPCSARIRQP